MFFTCCLCFVIIWNNVNSSLSCSITKSLVSCDKWATNVNLSPIFKSPWTCKSSWLTWFCWMKHNFNTCLRAQIQRLNGEFNSTPSFYKTIPFFPRTSCTLVASPLWDYFSIDVQFFWSCIVVMCNILNNILRSLEPYWHWYLWIAMSTNLMLSMNIYYITKHTISHISHVYMFTTL